MSILSTNTKLVKVGQEYSAGSGISIDDYVISVTGDVGGKTYSAGDNIGIYTQENQLYISGKDWEQDIANASANAYEQAVAQIPQPQDLSFISAQVDNKLNSSDFTDWQNGQYTTDLQTIEGQINNKLDSSSFSDVSGNFLTAINIPESATWNETSNVVKESSANWDNTSDVVKESSASWNQGKTYEGISPIVVNNDENKVSADTWTFSAGSNVSFVDDNVNKITRIDCTVTGEGGDPQVNSFVYENSAKINDVNSSYQANSGTFLTAAPANMATTGDVAELAQTISETYQTKGDYLTTADSANFYPANNPSAFITGVDLSNYYTKNETSGADELANAFSQIGPGGDEEVNELVHSNSGEWNDVSSKLNESTFQEASGLFLTAIPQEYLTESELPNYISAKLDISSYSSVSGDFLTSEDLNGYATESFVQDTSANITALIPTTTGFALKSDFTFRDLDYDRHYLTGVSGYTISAQYSERSNVATIAQRDTNGNYIAHTYYTSAAANTLSSMLSGAIDYVSGQVDNKLDTTSFSDVSGSFLTAVDLSNYYTKSETSGASEIADALSNIPTGNPEVENYVQTNSGTIDEVNANVTTNSGAWGGSALPISAGPGVKLQLVNNTLIVSNDETILYSDLTGRPTTVGSQLQLAESPLNFKYIEVYLNGSFSTGANNLANAYSKVSDDYITQVNTLMFNGDFIADSSYTQGTIWQMGCAYSGVSSTTWTKVYGYAHPITSFPSDWFTNNTHLNIYKIVGINRK